MYIWLEIATMQWCRFNKYYSNSIRKLYAYMELQRGRSPKAAVVPKPNNFPDSYQFSATCQSDSQTLWSPPPSSMDTVFWEIWMSGRICSDEKRFDCRVHYLSKSPLRLKLLSRSSWDHYLCKCALLARSYGFPLKTAQVSDDWSALAQRVIWQQILSIQFPDIYTYQENIFRFDIWEFWEQK